MEFAEKNKAERDFYKQDFSCINTIMKRIRNSLFTGKNLTVDDINLQNILDFDPSLTLIYITLFQAGQKPLRYGSRKNTLSQTLNRVIDMIRNNHNFFSFDVSDENKCRIMIEYIIERKQTALQKLHQTAFDDDRFEIGINGLELRSKGVSYYYMPSDAAVQSHLGLQNALEAAVKKTPIGKMTNKISERIKILKNSSDYEYYLIKSRAFVTYKNEIVPLYRGNVMYTDFSYDILIDIFRKSADWLIANMYDDGRFLYYYDCKDDSLKDHEHPGRKPDNLYYNDLRHCGGIVTLIRAYSQFKDSKYLTAAKKAIDFIISITKQHEYEREKAYYVFYNKKAKLGGTGMILIALMQYRIACGDNSYDEYIKGYVRHLLSRIYKNGEFLGYYIHPAYNEGKPLLNLNDDERRETFSFYYPGEAMLGLALFANHFDKDKKLVNEVKRKSEIALDWLVNERPKTYGGLFTALPSDAWLMQAVEEWAYDKKFRKFEYLNFVFTDAMTMMKKMYSETDSPYIDYDGGYFYNYGDHYFPDGARSEGLIAAYYLAKNTGKKEFANEILSACKRAAKCQFHLFNCEKSNFAHLNPDKSLHSIRFKATRQWVRVDSIQHTACFFIRLYWSEN